MLVLRNLFFAVVSLTSIKLSVSFFSYGRSNGCQALKNVNYRICSTARSSSLNVGSNELGRELDMFFERAAESGSNTIIKMTAVERASRAIRGGEIEDEIYSARDDLMKLEDDLFKGVEGVDISMIKVLREKINSLKLEYIDIVGANEIPLYFGSSVADSFQ